jgi:cytidine deaminase
MMNFTELYSVAEAERKNAYAPYSGFKVGAALIAANENGEEKLFTGCNVENSSYGACICAERTAAVKAVSEGYMKFRSVAVAGGTDKPRDNVMPCGICRQFLSEFASDDMSVTLKSGDSVVVWGFRELFAEPFTLK